MEQTKIETKELKILRKPQGEVEIFAMFGLMAWGVDETGRKFVKWGQELWVPADPEDQYEKKEEKK